MFEIGRICLKIAGRDAGKKCVIVDILPNNYVLIDGATRRRKCNLSHLEPLDKVIKIKKKASVNDVAKEFKKLKIKTTTTKPKKAGQKPKKERKKKEPSKEEKPKKETKTPKETAKPKKNPISKSKTTAKSTKSKK